MKPKNVPSSDTMPAQSSATSPQTIAERVRPYQILADTLGPVDPDFDMKTFCDGL